MINLQYTTIKDPLPDFIYEGLSSFSKAANNYHPQPTELIEKIAQKYGLPQEMIFLTAGTDESIMLFARQFGQNTFIFTPTYQVYAEVEGYGGKLTQIPSIKDSEYTINTDSIPGATLIYLANPNNPSGVTAKEEVMELVKNNPQAIVAIDEAYGKFANLSVADQIQNYPHMVIFRSFSKDYCLAGNRIGFIIAHPEVIKAIKNNAQWANTSYLSVGAAMVALDHEEYFKNIREDINTRRDTFVIDLKKSGFNIIPSKINAILFKFSNEEEGTRFANFLTQNDFVISHGNGNSNIGLDASYVRIAVGNQEQMAILKNTLVSFQKTSQ